MALPFLRLTSCLPVLGWDNIPGGAFKLEGEDDVISVTYLTDEAALGAEVAEEHVVGGVLHQCHQVARILALRYL